MITLLLSVTFAFVGIATLMSLADSAVRWRNAWRAVQSEMIAELSQDAIELRSDLVAFHNMRPVHRSWKARSSQRSVIVPLAAAA